MIQLRKKSNFMLKIKQVTNLTRFNHRYFNFFKTLQSSLNLFQKANFFSTPPNAYSVFVTMNLDTGVFNPGLILDQSHWALPPGPGTLKFDSNWVFYGSTEITVGSDFAFANPIGCTIYTLKVANSPDGSFFEDFVNKGFFPLAFYIHSSR